MEDELQKKQQGGFHEITQHVGHRTVHRDQLIHQVWGSMSPGTKRPVDQGDCQVARGNRAGYEAAARPH
jgi:hypothetical protein